MIAADNEQALSHHVSGRPTLQIGLGVAVVAILIVALVFTGALLGGGSVGPTATPANPGVAAGRSGQQGGPSFGYVDSSGTPSGSDQWNGATSPARTGSTPQGSTPGATPTPVHSPTPTRPPTPTPFPECTLTVVNGNTAKMYYTPDSGVYYHELTSVTSIIKAQGTSFPAQHASRASRKIQQTYFLPIVEGQYSYVTSSGSVHNGLVMMHDASTGNSLPWHLVNGGSCPPW